MIWTFKIELFYGEWEATIEIDATSTLEDLHFIMQEAVGFDNDHLYEFYISRTERSRDRVRFDDDNEGVFTATVESLYPLARRKCLYYMFDYGDSWLFKITKTRKGPKEARTDREYPRVVNEGGKKPEQYRAWEE